MRAAPQRRPSSAAGHSGWNPWPEPLPDAETAEAQADAEAGDLDDSAEPAVAAGCAAVLDEAALAALVLRICDQHEPSLARLYEAAAGRVYGLALRIVRQAPLAEEVVEDVFWQVWREAPRFDAERGKVMAWLLAIARSRAIDALRRCERVRASEVAIEDEETLDAMVEDRSDDPFDLVGASRHHARLHALLATLEPLPRQLLALAFFRGCTHEEIAEQTGLALGTVKSHIRRTLLALRAQLGEHNVSLSLESPTS